MELLELLQPPLRLMWMAYPLRETMVVLVPWVLMVLLQHRLFQELKGLLELKELKVTLVEVCGHSVLARLL